MVLAGQLDENMCIVQLYWHNAGKVTVLYKHGTGTQIVKNFIHVFFCNSISTAPFHVSEIFDDVEDMAWYTSKLLNDVIDEHAPMKRKLIKQESVPYMNGRLRKAMYQRNMARNEFRIYGKQYWQENCRQRNLVVSIRKHSLRN